MGSVSAKAVFLEAVEIASVAERQAVLNSRCGGDVELRREVEELLRHHGQIGGFLETPPTAAANLADTAREAQAACAPMLSFLSAAEQPGLLGRLDHYDILEVVGSGGFGVVLKARDTSLERIVAIKVLAESLAGSPTARKRFVREAKAAAAVRHDNVVSIHSVDDRGRVPYLVMEFVAGQSLEQRIKSEGPLELAEILRIGVQIAEGLAAAHQHGLVHRDVKPGNILLENGVQRVKITDFGLARAADDASLTQAGQIAGTPEFMSPEQARGTAIDQRSDLFALGSVLYAMCTGHTPFRASTTLAVLRKVCDEEPRPIRELNGDIPEWLAEIVTKLHAKDPAERFASAAEVEEVLRLALASLQQPRSVLRTPMKPPAAVRRQPRSAGRWLAAAAAALALVAITIGLAESQGVTQIAAIFVRVLTPDGTLVVESSDPGLKVTIEGDGGLTLTGAGLEEIRLRPGNYKLRAVKNGQSVPLEKELVSISKGGREVVKVKLERPTQPAASTELGAFVVLANGSEHKFDTLAQAVLGASDGDTIEVRGNGPFDTDPVQVIGHRLTIRSGDGFRPVIRLRPPVGEVPVALLSTDAGLQLEGLELQVVKPADHPWLPRGVFAVLSEAGPLRIANCTLLNKQVTQGSGILQMRCSPHCELRNCLILGDRGRLCDWLFPEGNAELIMVNCLQAGSGAICLDNYSHDPREVSVVLTRNTRVTNSGLFSLSLNRPLDPLEGTRAAKLVRLEAAGNIFDSTWSLLQVAQIRPLDPSRQALSAAAAESLLPRVLAWQGDRNLYSIGETGYLTLSLDREPLPSARRIATLKEWTELLAGKEIDSQEGRVLYQGGSMVQRKRTAPEQITPEDFRLRPDSAGYRAGSDGKDLGADIDLVGPGAAYERWKKTPEYQEWREETNKLTTAAVSRKPELGAFVVLDGSGAEVRKFDTLAAALLGASDGDTIEIHGNGPFDVEPIVIGNRAVTLRAASGFRPSLQLDSPKPDALLTTEGPLVLEGLELVRRSSQSVQAEQPCAHILETHGSELHVANCRFIRKVGFRGLCVLSHTATTGLTFRNSELLMLGPSGDALILYFPPTSGTLLVENCVCAGLPRWSGVLSLTLDSPWTPQASLRLRNNTWVTGAAFYLRPSSEVTPKPRLSIEADENCFDTITFLRYQPLKGPEAQPWADIIPKMLAWRDGGSCYSTKVAVEADTVEAPATQPFLQDIAAWDRLWNIQPPGSLTGLPKYQGGDVYAIANSGSERLKPDDFRLRPDSPGYRAGKDGKDLGADIDLVGPGAAYERWKKMPEYQQWLKETGQRKESGARNQGPEAKPN